MSAQASKPWHKKYPFWFALLWAALVVAALFIFLIQSFIQIALSPAHILLNLIIIATNVVSLFTYAARLRLKYRSKGFSPEVCATIGMTLAGALISGLMVSQGVVDISDESTLHDVAYVLFVAFTAGGALGFCARVFGANEKERPKLERTMILASAGLSLTIGFGYLITNGFHAFSMLSHVGIFSVFGLYPPIALMFSAVAFMQYLSKTLVYFYFLRSGKPDWVKTRIREYQLTVCFFFIGAVLVGVIMPLLILSVPPFGSPFLIVCICLFAWTGLASFGSKVGEAMDQYQRYDENPQNEKPHPDTVLSDERLHNALNDSLDNNGQRLTCTQPYKVARYHEDIDQEQAVYTTQQVERHHNALQKFMQPDNQDADIKSAAPPIPPITLAQVITALEEINCIAQAVAATSPRPLALTTSLNAAETTLHRLSDLINQQGFAQNHTSQQIISVQHHLQHTLNHVQQAVNATTMLQPGWAAQHGGWINLPNYYCNALYQTLRLCVKSYWVFLRYGKQNDDLDNKATKHWLKRLLCALFILPLLLATGVNWLCATLIKSVTIIVKRPLSFATVALFITALVLFSNPISATATLLALLAVSIAPLLMFADIKKIQGDYLALNHFLRACDYRPSDGFSLYHVEQLITLLQHYGGEIEQHTGCQVHHEINTLQQIAQRFSTNLTAQDQQDFPRIHATVKSGLSCVDSRRNPWSTFFLTLGAAGLIAVGVFLLFTPALPAGLLFLGGGAKITAFCFAATGLLLGVAGTTQLAQIYQYKQAFDGIIPVSELTSSYRRLALQQGGPRNNVANVLDTPFVLSDSTTSGLSFHHPPRSTPNGNGHSSSPSINGPSDSSVITHPELFQPPTQTPSS